MICFWTTKTCFWPQWSLDITVLNIVKGFLYPSNIVTKTLWNLNIIVIHAANIFCHFLGPSLYRGSTEHRYYLYGWGIDQSWWHCGLVYKCAAHNSYWEWFHCLLNHPDLELGSAVSHENLHHPSPIKALKKITNLKISVKLN